MKLVVNKRHSAKSRSAALKSAERGGSVLELPQMLTTRLRSLLRGSSVNAFARKCGIPESSMRLYLTGGKPRPDVLAKIAIANHISIDWLAADRGPREYAGELQAAHEDFIRSGYLDDVAATERVAERRQVLMARGGYPHSNQVARGR